ncbi:MAG TPA: dihydrolipoyl dehydrogenase [Bacteroidetes bacterium]|nr:dihydrolipoyl dehydrogenase [Bacteroidota bacterium]
MAENKKYDVTVIGSGPGGYVAAIRAAQLGFKTAIIERYATLGGTCLNVGCIPSKAMLDSSHHAHDAQHKFEAHGIKVTGLKFDLEQMVKRKAEVVKATTDGVQFLMTKNKIDTFIGHGSFKDKHTISILGDDGKVTEIVTDKTIIATGSKPATIPGVEIDKKRVISSTEALEITKIPKKLIVIGAGVIGLELGSVFARIGTEVTVVEYSKKALGGMDGALSREITKVLKRDLGFKFHFSHKVTGVKANSQGATVIAENAKGETVEFKGDYCLVATGRQPYTDRLGLENIGITELDRGRIPVDGNLMTVVEGVYAIGDVIKGAMLAHKASEEGVFVVEKLAGKHPHINYKAIPNVIYTWPEVAGTGFTEEELKADKVPYKSGTFHFRASGRARASMDTDGLVKVLSHKETDELLGMHIIGPRAADMIMEGVMGLEFRASAEDLAIFCHAHPTFSESIKEAAMDASSGQAIHK